MDRWLRRNVGSFLLSSTIALGACAAPTSEDVADEDAVVAGSEDSLERVDFPAGTELVTTTGLNLRSGPSTSYGVILVMPAGAIVTVAATSGVNGWLNVTYSGKTGYASGTYLQKSAAPPPPPAQPEPPSQPKPEPGGYSATRGGKMAARALALWNGHSSRGMCLAGVDDTAESASALPPGVSWIPRKPSAVAWQNYVNANPAELRKRGYERQQRSVNDLPKGSIIGWRAGQCGYHAQYGHIEVVVDDNSSRACSDYCGSVKKNCGDPYVYVPIEL
jgi:hypothetical protein